MRDESGEGDGLDRLRQLSRENTYSTSRGVYANATEELAGSVPMLLQRIHGLQHYMDAHPVEEETGVGWDRWRAGTADLDYVRRLCEKYPGPYSYTDGSGGGEQDFIWFEGMGRSRYVTIEDYSDTFMRDALGAMANLATAVPFLLQRIGNLENPTEERNGGN